MRYYELKTPLNELDDETRKDRVIRSLNKKRADDPIFNKTYKLIVGPMIGKRIEDYLTNIGKKDPDVTVDVISMLIKIIPELGKNVSEVKKFIEDWNNGTEFINIKELIPSAGMEGPGSILNIVSEGVPKRLFARLAKYTAGKSDAGPYEAALAIMSGKITKATGGGDLIIGNQKIEVKSGGDGGGGGRIINEKRKLNQEPISNALLGTTGIVNISVLSANGDHNGKAGHAQNWKEFAKTNPKKFKEIAKAINQVWFDGSKPEIESAFGKPGFRLLWNRALFDDYKNAAGHNGVLIIGQETYQYIVSGDQLYNYVDQKHKGYVYYPKSNQPRDLGIQVRLK